MEKESVLTVKDLSVSFHMYDKGLEQYDLKVISNLDLEVCPGEIVAIAGSSGSGKSLLAHAVMGLLPENAILDGEIIYKGRKLNQKDKEKLRGKELALVPQSVSYLDPLMRVEKQVRGSDSGKKNAQKKIFQRLRLKENTEKLYPFQLSGGMRQRVGIAMGMTYQPKLLLADEPTSALDVTTQAQIVRQMMQLRDDYHTSIIVVTHNLGVAAYMSDYIIVMKQGFIEDQGTREYILKESKNEYTRKLLDAVPSLGGERYV